jgi:hypothetical protein
VVGRENAAEFSVIEGELEENQTRHELPYSALFFAKYSVDLRLKQRKTNPENRH